MKQIKSNYFSQKIILLLSLMLLGITVSFANVGSAKYYRKATKYFKNREYYQAAQSYEKYLSDLKGSLAYVSPIEESHDKKLKGKLWETYQDAVYHLAESYRLSEDYPNAEKYYEEARGFKSSDYPSLGYWYAVTLRANKKYDEAIYVFNEFIKGKPENKKLLMEAKKQLADIDFIKTELKKTANNAYVVEPHTIKGQVACYALAVEHGDTLAFTSVETETKVDEKGKSSYSYATKLYESIYSQNVLDHKKLIAAPEDGQESGLASFTRDGSKMFFTKWAMVDGKKKSAIYIRTKTASGWSTPVKMGEQVNLNGFSSTEPYVTSDAKYLLFSSDRPGGQGGFDIWCVSLDNNLHASAANNLGNNINTAGDEGSPFYNSKMGTLVYASNGLVGMGGFDIYYSKRRADFLHWEKPVNPGAPINSVKDDMYYMSTDEDNLWGKAWLSSDRNSDAGLALFSVNENTPSTKQRIYGQVFDAVSKKPLSGVLIVVSDEGTPKKVLSGKSTDKNGRYEFELKNVSKFSIHVEKDGFAELDNMYTTTSAGDSARNVVIYLNQAKNEVVDLTKAQSGLKEDAKLLFGKVSTLGHFGFKKATLSARMIDKLDSLASILKENPSVKVLLNGYTDAVGSASYNIKLSQDRVDKCVDYLVRVGGIARERLEAKGYGEASPIAPEKINGKDNPSGRAENRRVEYVLMDGTEN
jgi:OmpA-OmpF porin, OOP family